MEKQHHHWQVDLHQDEDQNEDHPGEEQHSALMQWWLFLVLHHGEEIAFVSDNTWLPNHLTLFYRKKIPLPSQSLVRKVSPAQHMKSLQILLLIKTGANHWFGPFQHLSLHTSQMDYICPAHQLCSNVDPASFEVLSSVGLFHCMY